MPSEPRRAPTTYRLQLRGGIGFDEARVLVTYLERLGITDLYLSPSFTARRGSAHGYDVVDPTRLDPALGGRQAFERLARELRSRGMGLVLDVVPNHLAADPANPWWADVLRRGRRSRFARFFDIEWDAPGVGGRIVLPILPAAVDEVLGAGGFSIGARGDGSTLRVAGTWLPLAEGSEAAISEHGARWWNRDREAPSRVRAYRSLLEAQAYLPVWWREGNARVNHRRFFDISDLAAVRQEDPTVFRASHAAVLGLVRRGLVTGLRIDHVDGLADPSGYLDRLRRRAPSALLLVEKILAPDERIPPGWPVDGTTGYGVMNDMNDLFVDAMGWRDLGRVVERFGGRAAVAFDEIRLVSRRRALEELFPAEVG
ncbi:MAG TPA: alpha-amylase family glycosyl hydrolase, partial [Actinomycetota bacterium]|nr:alpha-amylase family glycosyl hydrolase [Actinomycetota bacterium]